LSDADQAVMFEAASL